MGVLFNHDLYLPDGGPSLLPPPSPNVLIGIIWTLQSDVFFIQGSQMGDGPDAGKSRHFCFLIGVSSGSLDEYQKCLTVKTAKAVTLAPW